MNERWCRDRRGLTNLLVVSPEHNRKTQNRSSRHSGDGMTYRAGTRDGRGAAINRTAPRKSFSCQERARSEQKPSLVTRPNYR